MKLVWEKRQLIRFVSPEAKMLLQHKEPTLDPNYGSNLFVWEPGLSHDLPHQVSFDFVEPLKEEGGKVIWYCGGLMLIAFETKEKAIEAYEKVLNQWYTKTVTRNT